MSKVDPLGRIPHAHIFAYRATTNQPLPNDTWTAVDFNAEGTENEATYKITHSPTTDFTIQENGWYRTEYSVMIDRSSAGNSRESRLVLNGSPCGAIKTDFPIGTSKNRQMLDGSFTGYFVTDDVITVEVYQDTGGQILIYTAPSLTYIRIIKTR